MNKIKPESDIGGSEKNVDIQQTTEINEIRDLLSKHSSAIKFLGERSDKFLTHINNKPSTPKKASGFEFTDEQLDLIRAACPQGLTDKDFNAFIYLCEQYELDPLKKEMHIGLRSGKGVAQVTRDGLLKIANRDPQFDGIGGDIVYEGDTLAKRDNESIHITYGAEHLVFNHEKITGAFANVYRKDRSKCTTVFVSFKDYFKKSTGNTPSIWEQFPNAMILKVAESMALKRAFSLSGLTSQEEVGE